LIQCVTPKCPTFLKKKVGKVGHFGVMYCNSFLKMSKFRLFLANPKIWYNLTENLIFFIICWKSQFLNILEYPGYAIFTTLIIGAKLWGEYRSLPPLLNSIYFLGSSWAGRRSFILWRKNIFIPIFVKMIFRRALRCSMERAQIHVLNKMPNSTYV